MKFHFLYHNGDELVFEAEEVKHYTGHAVVKNCTIIKSTLNMGGTNLFNKKFVRFNVALTDRLLGMYPEINPGDSIPEDK